MGTVLVVPRCRPPLRTRLNLRWAVRLGSWNILSLHEDARLPVLSGELSRLGISIAALSEVRRLGSGEISVGGYTYYWSGRDDGRRTQGVTLAVANYLVPLVSQVTLINERIMRLRIAHTMGVLSVLAVYAPTGVSDDSVKEAFYAQLSSVWDTVPSCDSKVILGDFNASTGVSMDGYESCLGPHGSGSRDDSSLRLLDFARSRGLRIAGSWFQSETLDLVLQ